MDRRIWLGLVASVAMAGVGCDRADDPLEEPKLEEARSSLPRDLAPDVSTSDLEAVVGGNTEFALKLQGALAEKGNSVFSPHSISIALGMTYAGARGETESQMAQALRFGLPQERLHPAFNALDLALSSRGANAKAADGGPFRLRVVNKVWALRGYSIEPAFLDTLALNYGAGVGLLDFVGAPQASAQTINDWVAFHTEGRIPQLLDPNGLSPLTRLVLTNAVYLNAAWASPFEEAATADAPFRLGDGATVSVPTMNKLGGMRAAIGGGVQAVELPFDGGELAMLFVMPDDLAAFEGGLDRSRLDQILSALAQKGVKLSLPRFKVELRVSLTAPLSSLGMPIAFSDSADFSGITQAEPLKIMDVIHQAFIEVREAGTEAAAATAVVVGTTSVPAYDLEIRLDRPFLYFVRDVGTGAVLFMGRVVDPR